MAIQGNVMTGNRTCHARMQCGGDRRGHGPVASNRSSRFAALAPIALLLALTLQCVDLRAELLFRSAEQIGGRQHWSALKKYTNPADTAYPRTLADGTQVAVEEVRVFFQGHITPDDVYGAKVMESLVKRGRQKIAGNSVSFAGDGGDVDAAMELGRLLRKLGVSTFVAPGERCLSSCVFAFMGGDQRVVAGQIGIHRPYFSSARKVPDRRAYYRQLQKRLQQYIEELDFPPSLYEAVMAVPPESLNILTAADLKKFYLHGMSPSTEDELDATAARNLGVSVSEYLEQKAQGRPCVGFFSGNSNCDRGEKKAADSGTAATDPGKPQSQENAPTAAGNALRQERGETDGPGATRGAATAPRTSF